MYVIDVIPLSRTAPGILSYRSATKLAPGSIVDVMLRRTKTQGIVVAATPVQEAKELLKNVRFQLSKSAPSLAGVLPPEIMQAAEDVARYHATSVGAVLSTLFTELIRAGVSFPKAPWVRGAGFERIPLELSLRERVEAYREHIQKDAASGAATVLIVPTIAETIFWKRELKAHTPLVLSGSLTGARRALALEKAATHQGLIIATPSFSWIPIAKLGSIIVERISAGTYTLPKRPYLLVPMAVERLAEARNIPYVFGDFPLPLELRPSPESPMQVTSLPSIQVCNVATKEGDKDPTALEKEKEPWAAVPKEIIAAITKELEEGGSVVAMAVRKGYAPAVVCRDCGQAQTDEQGMPYAFSLKGEHSFTTARSTSIPAARRCSRCDSWNLLPLGVGIERVEEELRKLFPKTRIVVAHAELLTTAKKAAATISEGMMPGSIVIGTESVLPWLYVYAPHGARMPLGVIVSADSLLALPFWRARERFVRLCLLLAGACRQVILVTRRPEDAAVDAALNPTHTHFWKEEAQLRVALHYPPSTRLIHIGIEDSPARAQALAAQLMQGLSSNYSVEPQMLQERTLAPNRVRTSLLLQIPAQKWPDSKLAAYLATLPPSVRVRLDPESL